MGRYRFRTPVIEAVQWQIGGPIPPRCRIFPEDGTPIYLFDAAGNRRAVTNTELFFFAEGHYIPFHATPVNPGDWVCCGPDGNYWVVPEDEFIEKYEAIDPEPATEIPHRAVDLN